MPDFFLLKKLIFQKSRSELNLFRIIRKFCNARQCCSQSLLIFFCYEADFLEEHRRVLDQRLQPVIREITDSRARTRDELEGTILVN